MLNPLSKLLNQVLAAPIWTIVVLALIAAIIGGPIAVVIWALIAVYGISWVLLLVVGRMKQSFAASLSQARTDLENAFKDVVKQCPKHCLGDLSIPECPLD
jgi:hypothetical protein